MQRKKLIERLKAYDATDVCEIGHALEILSSSNDEVVSNEDIGDIWERISKAIDHKYSGDEDHDAWALERELSLIYERPADSN